MKSGTMFAGLRFGARRRVSGFTLMEIAIVLAISGLVFGGIWAAANSAWQGYRASSAIRQIGVVLGNVRDRYAAIASWGDVGMAGNITKTIDKENILPSDMRQTPSQSGGDLDHAMSRGTTGGSFFIYTAQTSGGTPALQLRFSKLNKTSCINFLTLLPLDDLGIGMLRLYVNDSSSPVGFVDDKYDWKNITVPIVPSQAAIWCSSASDNEVDIDFRLH